MPHKLSSRISSIDALRGLVMVIMALDHARDFFYLNGFESDPTNLATTTAALFFTRWITHFCAPVFVFLAGTGAYLQKSGGKSTADLSRFLLSRGAWLVVVELTFVGFAWSFDPGFHIVFLQVIWALGLSMICLSFLVRLSNGWIATIGGVLVGLHNLLDGIRPDPNSQFGVAWSALHTQGFYEPLPGVHLAFWYPILPWIGVMALGYVFGSLYRRDVSPELRRGMLRRFAISGIGLFVLLRVGNFYGDGRPWSVMPTWEFSVMSFINAVKYPPSLLFLLMTLAPVMLLLRRLDGGVPAWLRPMVTFGRVPLFYYVCHIVLLHILAWSAMLFNGYSWSAVVAGAGTMHPSPDGFGYGLGGVYAFWIVAVVLLYPVCKWYDGFKQRHRGSWWVGYV